MYQCYIIILCINYDILMYCYDLHTTKIYGVYYKFHCCTINNYLFTIAECAFYKSMSSHALSIQ